MNKELLEEEQLHAQERCEENSRGESDRRTRIGSAGRQEEPVHEDMAGREEGEQFEAEGLGVPDADFPHVVVLVGMSSRKDIAG